MNQEEMKLTEWWENAPIETKAILSGLDSENASEYHYRTFWNNLHPSDKDNLHQYWQYRKGVIQLPEDDANGLQMEVICELADIALENEYGKSREDMCDEDGSFYEEYQDRFNDLYDEIEARLLDTNF